jgi:diguanylate cyclase (GGDEF)-like protein
MLDIDRLKAVNDAHGHAAGDAIMRAVVDRGLTVIRMEDILARYGGEEFAVLARSISHGAAMILAERLRAAIEGTEVRLPGGAMASVTASIGLASIAEVDIGGGSASQLVALAENRLARAKRSGRNRVCGES